MTKKQRRFLSLRSKARRLEVAPSPNPRQVWADMPMTIRVDLAVLAPPLFAGRHYVLGLFDR